MLQKLLQKLSPDQKVLLKGSSTAFIVRVFGILFLYGLTLYISNTYGSDVYGEYSFFVLSLKILSLLSIAGIDTYLLRYMSDDPDKEKVSRLSSKGSTAILFNALIIGIIVWLVTLFYPNILFSDPFYFTLLLVCIVPFSILRINAQSFRALKQTLRFSLVEYTAIPVLAILILFGFNHFKGLNTLNPTYAHVIAIVIVFAITLWAWQIKNFKNLIGNIGENIRSIPKTNKLAMPFLIAGSILFIGQWTVAFILKYFEGSGSFGNYDAALRIGYLLMLPLTAGAVIAAPLFSRKFALNDHQSIKKNIKTITNSVILITIPMLVIIYIFSDQLMAFYGKDFADSGNILRIILIGIFFNTMTGPVAVLLQMTENQSVVQNVFLISTCVNIMLCIILIPRFGIVGAAWSNVIFQFLVNGVLLLYVYRKFGYLSFGK